jgi:orotate phosphoribosyltransferase
VKDRLVQILRARSVRWGQFTLASGRVSDLYVDARTTTLSGEGAALIADLLLDLVPTDVVAVGGPVTGADPIVGAVVARAHQRGRPLFGFLVRKEPKAHGTGQLVEGRANLPDGAAVFLIEDTATTGGSLLQAIEKVQATGLRVVGCAVVVDREEGAEERVRTAGIPYTALVRRRDLV